MIIKFYPEKEDFRSLESFVREFALYACELIGLNANKISTIHIADHDNYTKAISSVCENESFSCNEYYVGVGKSITITQNGNVEHHLVYKIDIIYGLILYVKNKNTEKDYAERLSMEMFLHEFGHIVDNEARGKLEPIKPLDISYFSIDKISLYYTSILISEFFACLHSAFSGTELVFIDQNLGDNSNFETMFKKNTDLRIDYINNRTSLKNVAYSASQFFWMILVQYSKLIATKLGNNKLNSMEIKLFNSCPHEVASLLAQLEDILSSLINAYPVIPEEAVNNIFEIWHNVALRFGFFFAKGLEGDAVYFDMS